MLFSVKCTRGKTTLPRLLVNVILCGFLCQNKTAWAGVNPEDGIFAAIDGFFKLTEMSAGTNKELICGKFFRIII